MSNPSLATSLGPLALCTPLIAASGTLGSVIEFAAVADLTAYGGATAKSVSAVPWAGRPAPRVAPTEAGMLNAIGIQNPGIDAWLAEIGPRLTSLGTGVIGSAVGYTVEEYVTVATAMAAADIVAIEVNLSCPNLEGKGMFALDPIATAAVIGAVRKAVTVPIGAKLSPNAIDVGEIAVAAAESGADWVTVANTVWGAAIDIETRAPKLSAGIGGYSGVGIKPIAIRCVLEVRQADPTIPILGLGGVQTGEDAIEFMMAGAHAVGIGTAHFGSPKIGRRVLMQMKRWCERHEVSDVRELIGAAV